MRRLWIISSGLAAVALLLSIGGSEAAYIASDNAADPGYGNGWFPGSNGGVGFGAWRFDDDPSQYSIASAPAIDINNQSWAITAEYGTRAIRPFTGGALGAGQIVRLNWQFPGTNADDSEILLLDAKDNPIVTLLWGESPTWFGVATNGSWGTGLGAGPLWAVPGASAQVSFTLTSSNTLDLLILCGGNSVSFPNIAFTGAISEIGLYVDGPNDPTLADKTAYFNSLSVSIGANQVAPPVFSPLAGPLKNGQLVTLSTSTSGASIRYRTDGGIPSSTAGILYTNPVPLSFTAPTTVNAIAYAPGIADSPVTSATFGPPPSVWIGNNLGAVNDWSTSWPFIDVCQRMRGWATCNTDYSGPWDTGLQAFLPLDTNGWPTQVPFAANGTNQWVRTLLSTLNEPGTYQFIYEGTGNLNLSFPGPVGNMSLTATGGVQTYSFTSPSNGVVLLQITRSATNDYLRDFHLVLTNFLATYQTQPFHPLFLERLRPFRCLRFIDWGNVDGLNGPTVASWTNRPTPTYYTQAGQGGVALEYMAQLCNTLQADAWFNVPHMADDDYVRQAAQFWRDHLNANLRLYLEYSNETWNWGYPQTSYVQAQGVTLNLDPDPFTAGQKYVAQRSAQIWNIFQQVFGSAGASRLVKVMATQSSSTGLTDMRVAGLLDTNINLTGLLPDALAIAPYFGQNLTRSDLPPNAPYPTVDDVVTTLSEQSIAAQQVQVAAQKQIADVNGWQFVCYEGGQTFEGIWGAQDDTNLTAILEAANRDPRMFDRYTEYINMLQAQGVGLFNNFDYCEAWSQWGSWGSLEYQDQPTNQAPKYAALVEWVATAGPPRILQQPTNQIVPLGADVTLRVIAVGASPMRYQWQLNNLPLPGATNSTLTLSDVQTHDAGNYTVVMVNPPGGLTSAVATLTVLQATPILTWPDPTAITYGMALGTNQLDATANVPGSFAYKPGSGAVLPAGTNILSVTFTPADSLDYAAAGTNVSLVVLDALVYYGIDMTDPIAAANDNDGDGLSNLAEYALGTDPNNPTDGQAGLVVSLSQGPAGRYLSLQFKRRISSPGLPLDYLPEVSSDLQTWYSDSAHLSPPIVMPLDSEFDWVQVTDDAAAVAAAPRFIRLRISSY